MSDYQKKIIGWLPDSYAKDVGTNNYKIIQCITPELDLLKETFEEMKRSLNIEYAYGMTLDKVGRNVNQTRGTTNDTVLRTLIKAKIAADMSEGTINILLDVIGFIIGDEDQRSQIIELYNVEGAEEPAAFQVVAPIDGIMGAGVSLSQFVQLLMNVKAAGVRVTADLQGTFDFGEIADYGPEHDEGFGDIEQTVGGTLGVLYDPDSDDPLPI